LKYERCLSSQHEEEDKDLESPPPPVSPRTIASLESAKPAIQQKQKHNPQHHPEHSERKTEKQTATSAYEKKTQHGVEQDNENTESPHPPVSPTIVASRKAAKPDSQQKHQYNQPRYRVQYDPKTQNQTDSRVYEKVGDEQQERKGTRRKRSPKPPTHRSRVKWSNAEVEALTEGMNHAHSCSAKQQ
jgi:hypothetical protein